MKKVCLIIDSLGGGGAENNLLKIAALMGDMGHEVHVVITENIIEYPVPENIRLHTLSESRKIYNVKYIDRKILARRLKKVLGSLENSRPFDLKIAFLWRSHLLCRMANLKNVFFSIRNTLSKGKLNKNKVINVITKIRVRVLYNRQNIIGVSQGVIDDLIRQFSVVPKNATVINNPFDFKQIRVRASEKVQGVPEKPYIVHVGSFKRAKRQDRVLKAYHLADIQSHDLVFVGKGKDADMGKIREAVQRFGLAERVHFAGWQDNPLAWMKNADLLVLGSDFEGLPTVLIEALIVGTPVLSTNCPSGPAEVLTGELKKFLVPMDNIQRFADMMVMALETYPPIDESSLSHFEAGKIVEQYLNLKIT